MKTHSSQPVRLPFCFGPPAHLLMVFLLLEPVGCVRSAPASRIVDEGRDRLVRLEVTAQASAGEYTHPAAIGPAELKTILWAIKIDMLTVPPQGPFDYAAGQSNASISKSLPTDLLEFLSQQIPSAFAKATPLEEVLFFLARPRDNSMLEITSGATFVLGNQLHLLFANYRPPSIGQSETDQIRANPLKVLATPYYSITLEPFRKRQHPPGWASLLTVLPHHLVMDYKGLLNYMAFRESSGTTLPDPLPEPSWPGNNMAERLRELQQMRDEKLISEEELHTLRRKLLDAFRPSQSHHRQGPLAISRAVTDSRGVFRERNSHVRAPLLIPIRFPVY